MNKKYLRSKMVLYGDTVNLLAKYLCISSSRLSAKINEYDGAEFTQKEIDAIKCRYNLTADEVCLIFF